MLGYTYTITFNSRLIILIIMEKIIPKRITSMYISEDIIEASKRVGINLSRMTDSDLRKKFESNGWLRKNMT